MSTRSPELQEWKSRPLDAVYPVTFIDEFIAFLAFPPEVRRVKPGPLTQAEAERVRLHPYLTDRMLARVGVLGPSREIAARHHERLDGSGYPRGLTAAVRFAGRSRRRKVG